MSTHSEIDETLRLLGSVEPPPGLESRVKLQLQIPNRGLVFSVSKFRIGAVGALAASVALSAAILNPALRDKMFHHASAQTSPVPSPARVALPSTGGFGTASAVHVPVEPVPVQPTPVNQGRGRSRSGRAVLPSGVQAPLPRGVATPTYARAPIR
jgi:hypothetical protein